MIEEPVLSQSARAADPYGDDQAVARMTAAIVDAGCSIFQVYKLGSSDHEHVAKLLDLFAPPSGATVLDLGCGVGTVAALMREMRPDLEFILLNVSRAQLAMCPPEFMRIASDLSAIPLADQSVDAVMILYALGHGHLDTVFADVARVLRPGGILFIYDVEGVLPASLGYVVRMAEQIERAAAQYGFEGFTAYPSGTSTSEAERVLGEGLDHFAGTRPVVYRFVS